MSFSFSQGSQGGSQGGSQSRSKTEFFDCRYIIKDEDKGEWRQHKASYQLCISSNKRAMMVRPVLSEEDKSSKKDIVAFSEAWAANTHAPGIISRVGLKKIKFLFEIPPVGSEDAVVSRQFVLSFETVDIQPHVVALLHGIGFRVLEPASGGSTTGSNTSFGIKASQAPALTSAAAPTAGPTPPIIAASASTPFPTTPIVLPSHSASPLSAAAVAPPPAVSLSAPSPLSSIPAITPPLPVLQSFPSAPTTRTQNVGGVSLVSQVPATQQGTAPVPLTRLDESQHEQLPLTLINSHCECKCGKEGCRIGMAEPPPAPTKDGEMMTSLDEIYNDLLGTDDLASICNVLFGDWESLSRLAHRLGAVQSNSADVIEEGMKE